MIHLTSRTRLPIATLLATLCASGMLGCNSDKAGQGAEDAAVDGLDASDAGRSDTDGTSDTGEQDGTDAADADDARDGSEPDADVQDAADGLDTVDGADADAADGEPVPDCDTVCVEFVGVPESVPGDGIARVVSDECNGAGLDAGTCPGDLACVDAPPRWETPNLFIDTPVCELAADAALVFDVGPAPDAVPVALTFTLNGGAWPSRAADLTVFVTPRDEGRAFERLLLSDEDTLNVMLPRGVYDLDFSKPSGLGDPLPIIVERARLIVAEPGAATLDVEASPVDVVIDLDGAPLDDVRDTPEGQVRVAGRLTRPDGFLWAFTLQPTDVIAPVTVQHGAYALEIAIATTGAYTFRGRLGDSDLVEVSEPGETLRVTGQTALLEGQFDSAGEGALGETFLRLASSIIQHQYRVSSDGSFAETALATEYVARLVSTSNLDPDRFGGAISLGTITAPVRLEETFAFTRGSFRAFVNDERLERASQARVELLTRDGSVSTLWFDETGLASGTVLAAPAQVLVSGDGRLVPGGTQVLDDWEPTALPTRLDVAGVEVEVEVALDGDLGWPMTSPDAAGFLLLSRLDPVDDRPLRLFNASLPSGRTDSVTFSFPDDADAVLRPLLLPGRWQPEAQISIDGEFFSVQGTPFDVPPVSDPSAAPIRVDVDRRSITVTLEEGGRPLPDGSRGQIVFDTGAETLPTTGPATVTLTDVHQETGLVWFCSPEVLCSDASWLGRTVLATGLLP